MIWCCERMCGCAALLLPHIQSGMSAIAVWETAAAVAARGCVWASLCFVWSLCPFLLSGEFTLFVTTIFSIGCFGWDDDEGCSKM